FADVPVVVQTAVNTLDQLQLPTDRQSPVPQPMQYANLGIRQLPLETAYAVTAEFQGATGCDARVQLTQGARRRIARVGEGLATGLPSLGIEPLEAGLGHVHLAPHLQYRRPAFAAQAQGDVTYGSHIGGDVLAGGAIAPGRSPDQHAVFVQQADGQAIELGLAAIGNAAAFGEQVPFRQAQCTPYPTIE